MNRKSLLWMITVAVVSIAAVTGWMFTHQSVAAAGEAWAIKADIAEACSCKPVCPCLFGSPSTGNPCEGSRLIDIKQGHVGGVELDGIPVVVTFRMGGFSKYWISDKATDEQAKAAAELITHAFPSFKEWGIVSTEKVPVSIMRANGRMKFTVPTATVEMKAMEGRDGKPVTIHNMPAAFLDGYTQYVSVENSHESAEVTFEYSGTNGFTSRLEADGS